MSFAATAITAASISAGGSIIGGVLGRQKAPQQATYTPVDPNAVAAKTIQGNLQNLGGAEALASQTNSFNQQQATSLLNQAMPGFSALQQKLLGQVNSTLNNQLSLPQDTQDKIAQYAAEKGVTRGTSGNFNGFNLVKDFGFNMIDWQNAQRTSALNTLSTVFGMTPRINPMSPMSSLVDSSQAIGVTTQNNQMQYNAQQAAYNSQAAASNYNNMLLAGSVTNAANAFGSAYMMKGMYNAGMLNNGVQSQVLRTPNASGDTMTPYYVNGGRR
jgi:hypothetical protein